MENSKVTPGIARTAVIDQQRRHGSGFFDLWPVMPLGDQGEPTREQWAFLRSVIAWAEERMGQAPPPAPPPREELVGSRLQQALKAVPIGTWDWNIRTGELAWNETAMAVYGTDPADFASSAVMKPSMSR
jgi:PAS domain-containing protein